MFNHTEAKLLNLIAQPEHLTKGLFPLNLDNWCWWSAVGFSLESEQLPERVPLRSTALPRAHSGAAALMLSSQQWHSLSK